MKNSAFFIIVLFALTGCAKLQHLDQLLTLKDMSEEGDRIDRYVKIQDKKFEAIVEAVKTNAVKKYSTKKKIMGAFGTPILADKIKSAGMDLEKLLYRYAKGFFGSPKVYVYFDSKGELVKWTFLEPLSPPAAAAPPKP